MPDSHQPEPLAEKRMLLAFLLMGAILFATPYFYRAFAPAPARQPQPPKQQPAASSPAPATPAAPAPTKPAAPAPPAAPVSAAKDQIFSIETDLYKLVLSNRGAVVRSWVLKKYHDSAGRPLDLVSAAGVAKAGYPFSIAYKDRKPAVDLNSALFAATPSPDGLGIRFEFSDGGTTAEKTFRFRNGSYLSEFTSAVSENGEGIQHLVSWRGGFGDAAVQNAAGAQRALHFDRQAGKLIVQDAKAAGGGAVNLWGNFMFAGVEDHYFAAVFLPRNDDPSTQFRLVSDSVAPAPNTAETPHIGVAIGGDTRNRFELFVGPKDYDLLRRIDPRLEQLVNFGTWFGWLAKPLFVILDWLNDSYIHNYGWAIVIATVLINIALLPLRLSSMKSMKKMASVQPQVQAINAKYKGIGLRDPRNQEKNAEIMELYKKHGINPVGGGCLPMLLQIPFFFAFYTVLTVAIEMRGASWLWVKDLSQPEQIPIRILPLAMIVAQFVQQKMTPSPSADPAQQKMMMFMPLLFGFMFYSASSGLVLYWLTSNLVGIVQQYFINKGMGMPAVPQPAAAAPAAPAPKRKTGSKR